MARQVRSLSELVWEAMNKRGFNQTQLAATAGLSQSLISNILSGIPRRYTLETLRRLGTALEIDPAELISARVSSPPELVDDTALSGEVESLFEDLRQQSGQVQRRALVHLRRIIARPTRGA